MNSLKYIGGFFLMSFSVFSSYSQTCCSGGVPLSNNIGLPILDKGTFQFGVTYDYNRLNTLKEETRKLASNLRLRETHSVLLNMGYTITNNLSVEALFTWVNQKRVIQSNNTKSEASGFGDAIVLSRYRIFSNESTEVLLGAGIKLPTGATDKKNELGVQLNADLQPGSNTYDGVYMVSFSKRLAFRKSMSFSSRVTYRATGVNTNYQVSSRYKFGNEFLSHFTVSDQLFLFNQVLNPSLSFKYRQVEKDQINSSKISNTGGQWVFLIPSVSLNISPKTQFIVNAELPTYSKVEGIQLTPTYRLSVGVAVQLSKTNKTYNKIN